MRDLLFNNPWVTAWGHSLLHSLWLGAAWAIILYAMLRFIRPSADRYQASLLALGGFMISILAVIFGYMPDSEMMYSRINAESPRWLFPEAMISNADTTGRADWIPWLVIFWSTGTILFLVRLLAGFQYIRSIRRKATDTVPAEWKAMIQRISADLAISRRIQIKASLKVDMPMVYGWIRPVIYLPVSLMSGLSDDQLEAIFAHELAHIRRNDFIVNVVQRIIECIFFFNPFIWWISRTISQERERSCDDLAVKYCSDRKHYAEALTSLEVYRTGYSGLAVGLASDRNDLLQRIRRLIEPDYKQRFPYRIFGLALLFTAAFIGLSFIDVTPEKKDNGRQILQATVSPDILPSVQQRDTIPPAGGKKVKSAKPESELSEQQMRQIELALQSLEEFEIPEIDFDDLAEINFDPAFDVALSAFEDFEFGDMMARTYAALDTNIIRNDSIRMRLSREQREEMRRAMEEIRRAQMEFRENHREEMMKLREELLQQREELRRQWHEVQEELRENLGEMDLSPEERERLRHELMRSQELLQREMHRQQEEMQRMGRFEVERAQLEMQRQQEQMERMARIEAERARSDIRFRQQEASERVKSARDEILKVQREMERAEIEKKRAMIDRERMMRRGNDFKSIIENMLYSDGYLDNETPLKKLKFNGDDVRYNGKKIPDQDKEKYIRVFRQFYGDAKASYDFSE